MEVLRDYNLVKYNNLRLHSVAKEFFIPESYDDLMTVLKAFQERRQSFYILSGGSNVLLKPAIKTPVISLAALDKTLTYDPETNTVTAGCSVKIQTLINFLADQNLGGIEYLYSLPALVGGCVYMNAGRGRKSKLSISDHVVAVEYMENEQLKRIAKEDCGFGYRKSVFQNTNCIITKVLFRFPCQEKEITKKKIKERLEYVKVYQEPQRPSLGSIFCSFDPGIMKRVSGVRIGSATYSRKTPNWISNLGHAKYSHIMALIGLVKCISFCLAKKAKLEVRILK